MDGIEWSVISLRQVKNFGLRFDSEYYKKINLRISERIETLSKKSIGGYGGFLDCSAFYPSITGYYSNDRKNVPFLRVNEIKDGLIVITNNTVFLPIQVIEDNTKTISLAYPGDIIIAKGGNTLAKVGLVTDEFPVYATCRDVIILRTNNLDGINKYYLWAFLHSEYGQTLLWRSASQTGQPHLTLASIMNIRVPDLMRLQENLSLLYDNSVNIKRDAETNYHKAEALLSTALDSRFKKQISPVISVQRLSESYEVTGRLDAEYYQSKYEAIENALNTNETISSMCTLYDDNYVPDSNSYYRYIELANVGASGEIADAESIIGEELPTRARRIVKSGQVIVSSIEGSLQSCALITDEFDGAICSTGFYVVDSDKLSSETLLVLFKSEAIQELLKQRCSGTILTSINKDEFLSLPLPKIDEDIQAKISEQIKESFALRRKSKQLLEDAKRAVEIAIEQDEESAIEWLKDRKKEAGV